MVFAVYGLRSASNKIQFLFVIGWADLAALFDENYIAVAGLWLVNKTSEQAEIGVLIQGDTVLGSSPSTQADLLSIAVISYEMLTGKKPFQGRLERCGSLADFSLLQYEPSCLHNPYVPQWMDGAIKKALSISPQLRHHDVSDFFHDLQYPNSDFRSPS